MGNHPNPHPSISKYINSIYSPSPKGRGGDWLTHFVQSLSLWEREIIIELMYLDKHGEGF
jgi:hypothetical protein